MTDTTTRRPLGNTGLHVSPLGFGAFKIGRNQKTKYPGHYDLPSDEQVAQLIAGCLDLGINHFDTAPAYGLSESRLGPLLKPHRREVILSTKVGETFENGESTYDFSRQAVTKSLERSLQRLQTDVLDMVLIHSDGRDADILQKTDVVAVLQEHKSQGKIRAIGLSGKTPAGAELALDWADVLMVEYHLNDRSHEAVMRKAAAQGVGVLVKKGLAAGHLAARDAIEFVLAEPSVTNLVVGGLNLDHIRANWQTACTAIAQRDC